jgi:hypothetical protein
VDDEQLQEQFDALNIAYAGNNSCCDSNTQPWCSSSSLQDTGGDCSTDTGFQFAMATLDNATGELLLNTNQTTTNVSDDGSTQTCITRTANDTWTTNENALDMKQALHRGDRTVLNVYIISDGLLGYAILPWRLTELIQDGVVVRRDTLPGGEAPFDEGDTMVHEVGHCELCVL